MATVLQAAVRNTTRVESSASSTGGSRTPIAWLEARSRATRPIPHEGGGRRGSRTLEAHRSPGFGPGAVAHRLALPIRRAPAAGIEPASSRLTAGRSYQHELHRNHDRRIRQSGWPDSNRRSPAPEAGGFPDFPTSRVVSITEKCPAGVEPARPPWRGGRLPLHHGHLRRPRIVKEPRAPGGTRTRVAALCGRSLRRWTTSACIGMGPEGLEPSPNRLRAGRSAARTSVPFVVASRPGRSRTSAARLSAGCSPVELQAVPSLLR